MSSDYKRLQKELYLQARKPFTGLGSGPYYAYFRAVTADDKLIFSPSLFPGCIFGQPTVIKIRDDCLSTN